LLYSGCKFYGNNKFLTDSFGTSGPVTNKITDAE
jgi:hypothetical protein